uniref:Transposon Tol2 DNA, Uncharacterized protein n=1 Tax=Nothobranchius korthausae TaxID=1143690 RepID=A0A1A8FTA6_9TELE
MLLVSATARDTNHVTLQDIRLLANVAVALGGEAKELANKLSEPSIREDADRLEDQPTPVRPWPHPEEVFQMVGCKNNSFRMRRKLFAPKYHELMAFNTSPSNLKIKVEEDSDADLLQSDSPPSPVPTPICPRTLQDTFSYSSPMEKVSSPGSGGGLTSVLTSPGPAPKRRKKMEDVLLKRLDRIEHDKAVLKDTEDIRFGYVVADLLGKIPSEKKMSVQFKIYQLLFEAIESKISQ